MDIQRNLHSFSQVEQKYKIKLKTHDPNNRLSIKNYLKVDSEVAVVRFNQDDTLLAAGCTDGTVQIFEANKVDRVTPLVLITGSQIKSTHLRFPTTALRWRTGEHQTPDGQILITANTDGTIHHWSTKTQKSISSFKEEEENEVFGLDLNKDESLLATCGKDCKVSIIYDEETNQLCQKLTAIEWTSPGHNNRIFSVKFSKTDSNIVLSGGWDLNVVIWVDIRQSHSVGTILGPKIAGDSIDIQGDQVLTGSNRMSEQLQLWDLRTQKMIENIKWDLTNDQCGAFVFAAQFSKQKAGLIAGAASGTNEVKIFEKDGEQNKPEVGVSGFSKGIYGFDFGNSSNKFAFGGGDGLINIFSINYHGHNELDQIHK